MAKATLEGIPTELQILIIERIPDRQTLSNIVHASPAFHQAYVRVRPEILSGLVHQQSYNDGVSIGEVIVAIRSKGVHAAFESNRKEILALLDYRRRPQEIQLSEQPTVEEWIQLLHLRKVFDFMMRGYPLTVQCPPFLDSEKWKDEKSGLRLSDNEKTRFLRALYRLETFCNIFGIPEYSPGTRRFTSEWLDNTYSLDDMWALFFATMPPWEMEEFGCISAYIRQKYEKVFSEIADDLSEYGPRFRGLPPWELPCECFELYPGKGDYHEYLDNMVCLSPCFLYKVLHQKPYEKRRDLMAYNIGLNGFSFLTLAEWVRPWTSVSPADRYERTNQDVETFWSTLPVVERPNLGWRRFWYADRLIRNVSSEDLFLLRNGFGNPRGWEWGYAFWDGERLARWGIHCEPTVRGSQLFYTRP